MNEELYFLKAINAGEPNADLIYADWLEEQGRPEADGVRDPVVLGLRQWSRYRQLSESWSRYRQLSESWSKSYRCSCSRSGLLSRTQSQSWSRRWSWCRSVSSSFYNCG